MPTHAAGQLTMYQAAVPKAGGLGPPVPDLAAQFAQSDQVKRLCSLEDLMRSNESTVSNILTRLQELELGVTQSSRQRDAQFTEAVSGLSHELAAVRRRVDEQEHTIRVKAKQIEDVAATQGRAHTAAHDTAATRLRSDSEGLRQQLSEVEALARRVDSQLQEESRQHRLLEQDAKWIMEHYKEQFTQHGEALVDTGRKLEGVARMVSAETAEREQLAASVRQTFEESMRALGEQTVQRVQQEVAQRLSLASETAQSFKGFRAEVQSLFDRSAAANDESMRSIRSVETILRAEIRARMEATEEQARRIGALDERCANDAQVLAKGLQDLDEETTGAVRELRESVASEYRSGIEQVARRVGELQQVLQTVRATVKDMEDERGSATQHASRTDVELGPGGAIDVRMRQIAASEMSSARTDVAQQLREALRTEMREMVSVEKAVASMGSAGASLHVIDDMRAEVSELKVRVQAAESKANRASDELLHKHRTSTEVAADERRAVAEMAMTQSTRLRDEMTLTVEQLNEAVQVERHTREQWISRLDETVSGLCRRLSEDSLVRKITEVAGREVQNLLEDARARDMDSLKSRLERDRRVTASENAATASALADADRRLATLERTVDGEVSSVRDDARRDISRMSERLEDFRANCETAIQKTTLGLGDQVAVVRRGLELEQRVRTEEDVQLRALVAELTAAAASRTPGDGDVGLPEQSAAAISRVIAAQSAEQRERGELRRLLEDQIRDTKQAIEFIDAKLTQHSSEVSSGLSSLAERVQEQSLECARKFEGQDETIDTLQSICKAVRDHASRERATTEEELKLYVDEKLSQVLALSAAGQ